MDWPKALPEPTSPHSNFAALVQLRSSRPIAWMCGFVLIASLTLGGGTRSGFLSDAILQLIATPLLLIALWRNFAVDTAIAHRSARAALAFASAYVLIPALQLIPLPPTIWTLLPGRDFLVEAHTLTNRVLPSWPISVAPQATWLGLVSLVVPLSIFLTALQLERRERRALSLAILAVGVASVFLGLLQLAQGPNSPLRFFAITNPTEAVGFFANRNHFAALLYCLTLLAAAWTVHFGTQLTIASTRQSYDTPLILALFAGLAITVSLIAAQIMTRSRAGMVLAILALLGILALGIRDRTNVHALAPVRLMAGAVGIAFVLGIQFALYRVVDRFGTDPLEDARIPLARTTFEAAINHLPFGSGAGTFVPVYKTFEKVDDAFGAYVNRAHNDVLEVILEAGLPALALMSIFLLWLIRRTIALWRAKPPPGGEIDLLLAQASALALALLAAHSFVDYPLRTAAMMAFSSFAAALLFEPPDEPKAPLRPKAEPRKKRKSMDPQRKMPQTTIYDPAFRQRDENDWSDFQWPDAWRGDGRVQARKPKATQST